MDRIKENALYIIFVFKEFGMLDKFSWDLGSELFLLRESSKNFTEMAVIVNYSVVFMPPVIPAQAGI